MEGHHCQCGAYVSKPKWVCVGCDTKLSVLCRECMRKCISCNHVGPYCADCKRCQNCDIENPGDVECKTCGDALGESPGSLICDYCQKLCCTKCHPVCPCGVLEDLHMVCSDGKTCFTCQTPVCDIGGAFCLTNGDKIHVCAKHRKKMWRRHKYLWDHRKLQHKLF